MNDRNSADVIVVGGGGAGLCAAAEAARLGRSVILLEKTPKLGGTTAIAVGSLMAACTAIQRKAGIEDSPRRHEQELVELGGALGFTDNPALRRLLVDNVPDTVDFLASIGVDFIGPLLQPPFKTPRFYQALPGGRAYVHRLSRLCRKLGVELRTSTPARRLLMTAGRVSAVEIEPPDGGRTALSALAGVILASGDFSANREMRRDIMGPGAEVLDPINLAATGDGQRMGVEVGGALALRPDYPAARLGQARFGPPAHPSLIQLLPPYRIITLAMRMAMSYLPGSVLRPFVLRAAMTALAPERAIYEHGAILINREGKRFADEMAAPVPEIARQPQGEAFVVFDHRIATLFNAWPNYVSTAPGVAFAYIDDYRKVRNDIFFEAPSVEALAGKLGVPAAQLKATIDANNTSVARKDNRLVTAPYFAMGPLKAWLLLTHVGLAVNTRLQVLDGAGQPIPGLYAAGGAGQGGFASIYHGHSLGWALTSGRLAGRYASFEL